MGLMNDAGPQAMMGEMHLFRVTQSGILEMRNQIPAPPRLSRSQIRFQRFKNSSNGMSFREWLKTPYADLNNPA